MTFCDLVTICDTWFDGKFYKKQVLSLRTYDSKVTGLQRQFGIKKLAKTMFFALFLFFIKQTNVGTIPIILLPYVKFPALQNGNLRI